MSNPNNAALPDALIQAVGREIESTYTRPEFHAFGKMHYERPVSDGSDLTHGDPHVQRLDLAIVRDAYLNDRPLDGELMPLKPFNAYTVYCNRDEWPILISDTALAILNRSNVDLYKFLTEIPYRITYLITLINRILADPTSEDKELAFTLMIWAAQIYEYELYKSQQEDTHE